ncbi:hypothetical protein DOY81_009761, partial [Sarcophaga bullata]
FRHVSCISVGNFVQVQMACMYHHRQWRTLHWIPPRHCWVKAHRRLLFQFRMISIGFYLK